MEQRHTSFFGAHQEARLQQQHVQRHRLHGHGLSAHVGAGDDRGPGRQGDGHRHEAAALLLQQIADLRIDHILQLQVLLRQLRLHTAVAHGKQCLLDNKVQTPRRLRIGEQLVHHRGQCRTHGLADVHLLRVLLAAQPGALQAQIVLFRVGLGVEQPFLHLFFGGADLLQLGRGAVRDIEAPAPGTIRVQHRQCVLHLVEGHALEVRHRVDLLKHRAHTVQPLQIALDLEQLHMVRRLPRRAAAQGVADILHLAQAGHQLVVHVLQLAGGIGRLLHVVQLLLQCSAFLRRIKPQPPDAFLPEGRAAVQCFQRVLQTDLLFFLKLDRDHASSSFTLMTGTSTAAFMRNRNSSLSNFHP